MANPLKGEAQFSHDGQVMKILFDVNAWLAIEDALDIGMLALIDQLAEAESDGRKVKIGTLATVLLCGLAAHHPDTTLEDAAGIMMLNGGAQEAMGAAIRASLPQMGDPGADHPKKPVTRKARPSPAKPRCQNGTGRKR